jgi:glycosyltransferase involved in cell wall biosynthesis
MEQKDSLVFMMELPTVALTIIMKNEENLIESCIESAMPFVDAVVVVDTGSTDKSVERVKKTIADFPGTVVELPWKGFAESRNDALNAAYSYSDYALMIDADSKLMASSGLTKLSLCEQLVEPAHRMHLMHGNTRYSRPQITHRDSGAKYRGVLHEFVTFPSNNNELSLINGFVIQNNELGMSYRNRSSRKYFDDAIILRKALEGDVEDLASRYTFYLAQSYLHAGMPTLALENYEKRLQMGGWPEELYISALSKAQIMETLNHPSEAIIAAYLSANEYSPNRAESLCFLARYARVNRIWNLAYRCALWGLEIPEPQDSLFTNVSVYQWRLRYELSISSWYLGKFEQGFQLCEELLKSDYLNDGERKATLGNLDLYRKKINVNHTTNRETSE